MKKETIEFRDPVVESVCKKLIKRSDVGVKKYGVTLRDERLTKIKNLKAYLIDVQEELMDACNYIEAALETLDGDE